jgi:hypothetical protein
LFEQEKGLQILRIQKLGLQIPTTNPHHSAKNKIGISGGRLAYDPKTGKQKKEGEKTRKTESK